MLKRKKFRICRWVLLFALLFIAFSLFSKGMDKEIPPAEKEYINSVLDKITAGSSKEDVISLLGENNIETMRRIPKADLHNHFYLGGNKECEKHGKW